MSIDTRASSLALNGTRLHQRGAAVNFDVNHLIHFLTYNKIEWMPAFTVETCDKWMVQVHARGMIAALEIASLSEQVAADIVNQINHSPDFEQSIFKLIAMGHDPILKRI